MQSLFVRIVDEIKHGPMLRIHRGTDDTCRFVHHQIQSTLGLLNRHRIQFNTRKSIHLMLIPSDDLPVHKYPPSRDQPMRLSPAK